MTGNLMTNRKGSTIKNKSAKAKAMAAKKKAGRATVAAVRSPSKADAAQHANEQVQQAGEALEEKVENAKAVLAPAASLKSMPEGSDAAGRDDFTRSSVAAAINVLNS